MVVASIREACRRILEENGHEVPVTVQRIAEVAGVTIGSFYQYYPNKEGALFDVLLEDAPDEAERIAEETRFLGRLRWESVDETLSALVDVTCDRHQRLLARHGESYRRFHGWLTFDALVLDRVNRDRNTPSLDEWLREMLLHHYPRLDAQTARLRAFLLAGALRDQCARAVTEEPDWLATDCFRRELKQLLVSYART